ncbi:MAG: 4Fe-4S dicluster domain-containing protein [Clostridiaceae bacterium]|nr:4Fe-4S dicluster domain-containing protein [Clostridiaceae bacterium]
MKWSKEAEERIKKAPFFIRSLARKKAEELARSQGKHIVEVEDIEKAKNARDLQDVSKIDLSIEGVTDTTYREIKLCGGMRGCPLTLFEDEKVVNCLHSAIKKECLEEFLEERQEGPVLYHHKLKAAVSGCPNGCSQPQIKDMSIIGYNKPQVYKGYCIDCNQCVKACPEKLIIVDQDPSIDDEACIDCGRCIRACPTDSIQVEGRGYRIIIGGRLGRRPHLAKHLVDVTSLEELETVLTTLIQLYKEWIAKESKISNEVENLGIEEVRELLELKRQKEKLVLGETGE